MSDYEYEDTWSLEKAAEAVLNTCIECRQRVDRHEPWCSQHRVQLEQRVLADMTPQQRHDAAIRLEERAAVVRFLRAWMDAEPWSHGQQAALRDAANAIERGDHLKEPTT